MRRSSDAIRTTHTGSLPRPDDLTRLLWDQEQGAAIGEEVLRRQVEEAVSAVVERQRAVGLDIINDGEAGKLSYAAYASDRLTGFSEAPDASPSLPADLEEFPSYAARLAAERTERNQRLMACIGPIAYVGLDELSRDLANLRAAVGATNGDSVFMTAASPGVIALFSPNLYYCDHEAYVWAIAQAMRIEYEAIFRAGFTLQLDCPDLGAGGHSRFAGSGLDDFRRVAAIHIAALNYATASIPPERMRLHLCWGNYEGPHHRDVPLRDLVDLVLGARPAGLSVEAANPRHGHEWQVWQRTALPEEKVLIPGVIDTTTNFIEHPELVADRILRFVDVVGFQQVIAGTDCGLATVAGTSRVDSEIAWAKLAALVEGARLASMAVG
jgi:5-methyltetrahydropteroyltriglutamate--homocysteine methyltransferase